MQVEFLRETRTKPSSQTHEFRLHERGHGPGPGFSHDGRHRSSGAHWTGTSFTSHIACLFSTTRNRKWRPCQVTNQRTWLALPLGDAFELVVADEIGFAFARWIGAHSWTHATTGFAAGWLTRERTCAFHRHFISTTVDGQSRDNHGQRYESSSKHDGCTVVVGEGKTVDM